VTYSSRLGGLLLWPVATEAR